MAVKLNLADLQFILDQIKISEAHAAGADLADLIPDPHVPWGLRTVDGTYNNFLDGREKLGLQRGVLRTEIEKRDLHLPERCGTGGAGVQIPFAARPLSPTRGKGRAHDPQ